MTGCSTALLPSPVGGIVLMLIYLEVADIWWSLQAQEQIKLPLEGMQTGMRVQNKPLSIIQRLSRQGGASQQNERQPCFRYKETQKVVVMGTKKETVDRSITPCTSKSSSKVKRLRSGRELGEVISVEWQRRATLPGVEKREESGKMLTASVSIQ